jgi:hypothetical protein
VGIEKEGLRNQVPIKQVGATFKKAERFKDDRSEQLTLKKE